MRRVEDMKSLKRESFLAAMAVLLALLLLVLGIWLGGHPSKLPGFMRTTFVANHETQVVNEAIERVSHDYYRPVTKASLSSSSIAGMVSSLKDPYSTYLSPSEFKSFDQPASFAGIGVSIDPRPAGLEVVRVFDTSPAQRAGLKVGDLIVGVNGRSLHKVPANTSVALIKGPAGTDVRLTVKSHAKPPRTITVMRATISEPVVASTFVPSGVIVTTRGRTQPTTVLTAAGGAIPAHIPVVVLVDHDTASASEIVTAALQDHHRATVVGTHTYGKGVFQELEPLSNGGALDITVGEYFTPNGRNLGG